ncbi:Uncharacterized protein Y057_815 [Fusarium fujikuroi]|nr:Uncharacterized protein Y057_815 [Fusarium fujikuroi]
MQPAAVRQVDICNPELFEKNIGRLESGCLCCLGDLFEYSIEKEVFRFNHSYPFITLPDTTLGSIISGLTFNSKNITETIGVVKASKASKARSTSNHHNVLKLTELDVLDTIETIKAAIAYKIDGARA